MDAPDDAEGLVLAELAALLSDLRREVAHPVALDTDLRTHLGLDSLAMVELVDRVGSAAGVILPDEVLGEAGTPRALARAVRAATEDAGLAAGTAHTLRGYVASPRGATGTREAEEARVAPSELASRFSTLAEALAWLAAAHPEQVTIRLLHGGQAGRPEKVTYGDLHYGAQRVARGLVAGGLRAGDRVALLLGTDRSYFTVFAGVLLAGGVPVPLYPPARPAVVRSHLERTAALLRNVGASVLVALPEVATVARIATLGVPSLRAVRTPSELSRGEHGDAELAGARAGDVALVQYTSGSTGDPKGVVLTHAQLLANVAAMARAAAVTPSDVVVSWLPLYHDMGLVGMWHAPLVLGIPLVVMSPLAFLARPVRWLEAISSYRGSISAAPSFAYGSCAGRVRDAELAGLDLSSWRLAFNGSEPVAMPAVDAFVERFAHVGFRRESMCPAYGLAEAGVGIAFSPPGRGPRVDVVSREELSRSGRAVASGPGEAGSAVVASGYPLPGYEIRVADALGGELPDRREGRVLCRGPSLTDGYFANERATRALWQRGWLDTGDLGYLVAGELFLTGRAKDVAIRAGRNLHLEDVEGAVRDVPGVRSGGVAACTVPGGPADAEQLVVVVESDPGTQAERAALEESLRRRVAEELDLVPDTVLLVRLGAIRRTPSGKVRRGATAAAVVDGTLEEEPAPVVLQLATLAAAAVAPAARAGVAALSRCCFAAYAWTGVALLGLPLVVAVHLPIPLAARWRLTRVAAVALARMLRVPVARSGALPRTGPAVVVANHPSFVDAAIVLLASTSRLTFVTSTDFEEKPVVGSFLRRIGCAFVSRGDPTRSRGDLAALAGRARSGEQLVFFPEGSLAPAPGLRPFHLGAFVVAAAAGCPIVPVAIAGTREIVRPGSYLPRRAAVSVTVERPVAAPAGGIRAGADSAATVRERIASILGQPLVS